MKIVDGRNYLNEVKELILEYTKFLDRDLSFQNLEEELNDLSSKYVSPNGEIRVALKENQVVGMVAYHKLSDKRCEMKRLYVKENYRYSHMGEALVDNIIECAKRNGYKEMVLDTIVPLQGAIHLYHKCGFKEIDAYYDNPMNDVIYMGKDL